MLVQHATAEPPITEERKPRVTMETKKAQPEMETRCSQNTRVATKVHHGHSGPESKPSQRAAEA